LDEEAAFGDAGYQGVHKGPTWHVAMRPGASAGLLNTFIEPEFLAGRVEKMKVATTALTLARSLMSHCTAAAWPPAVAAMVWLPPRTRIEVQRRRESLLALPTLSSKTRPRWTRDAVSEDCRHIIRMAVLQSHHQ
jgi:hypothetical protein